MNKEKILEELKVLRGFIDFINRQVGVYCDCLASFQGNKVRIERQVARVNYPASKKIKDGVPIIVWASVEDPTRPDVIHHRIIRADEFIAVNSESGFNEQQLCWSIIVFIFAYWDEKIRPQIAIIRGVVKGDIKLDALGDLRTLRMSIVHHGGIITDNEYAKLKLLSGTCSPNSKICPTHDQMHTIFVAIKQAVGKLILEYTGNLPGAAKAEEIVDIAIENA